ADIVGNRRTIRATARVRIRVAAAILDIRERPALDVVELAARFHVNAEVEVDIAEVPWLGEEFTRVAIPHIEGARTGRLDRRLLDLAVDLDIDQRGDQR